MPPRLAPRAAPVVDDAGRARARYAFLSRASRLVGQSLEEEEVLREVGVLAVGELCDACAVWLVRADRTVVPVEVAHRDEAEASALKALLQRFPLRVDRMRGLGRVLRQGGSEVVGELTETHFRALSKDDGAVETLQRFGLSSALAVPLPARGHILGAMVLARRGEGRRLDQDDLALAQELGRLAALAVDNARLYRREQAARARAQASEAKAALLAELSRELSSSFDLRESLPAGARLLVPAAAEWCLVDLVVESERRLERYAVAHADPERHAEAQLLTSMPPSLDEATGVARVVREARPLIVSSGAREVAGEHPRLAPRMELLSRLGLVSALVVPLVVRGRVVGALSLIKGAEARRPCSEAELPFAVELASRLAHAVDNARLYEEARREIALRESFLSIASHELKTPLTSMSLNVQGLQRLTGRADLDEASLRRRLSEKLDATYRQMRRLGGLVDELLDVTRINAGRLELAVEAMDLSGLVREVAERFEPQRELAGCAISVDVPARLDGRWDRPRLEQVVTNLVENALKYGAGKAIALRVVRLEREARVVVEDHGIGIAREAQERLFTPFVRAVSARQFAGLGLGLYISRRIVEAHGGTVELESAAGEGARFTVRLPLATGGLDGAGS